MTMYRLYNAKAATRRVAALLQASTCFAVFAEAMEVTSLQLALVRLRMQFVQQVQRPAAPQFEQQGHA